MANEALQTDVAQETDFEQEQLQLNDRLDQIQTLKELAEQLAEHLDVGATAETVKDADHAIAEARRLAIELANLR